MVHSVTAACIQIQDNEVCLLGGESLSLSPEKIPVDALVVNPSQTRISIIPLLDVVHRTAFYHLSTVIREQRCYATLSFNGRREWINGIILSRHYSHVKGHHYLIVGSNKRRSRETKWSFVDYQESREELMIRMGGASEESFDTYMVVSNALEFCQPGVIRELIAYNPMKVNFGVFEFYKHV